MQDSKRDILRRFITWLFCFGVLGVLIALIVLSAYLFDAGVKCPFYYLLHWNCPGCGGTRMAIALLDGDVYQALRYNAYVLVTLPSLVYVFIRQSYEYIKYNRLINWLDKYLVVYCIGFLAFGFLRNTEIFSWLAPTIV